MIISVIGSSNPTTQEHLDLAEGVGRELARRGIMVVCGGLSGIMEAVCRNVIAVHTGEAVSAVGGAFGTLSEIGHALGDGIPVVGLKTWPLTTNGDGVDIHGAIIQADDAADAVDKALAAVAARDDHL